MHIYIYIYIKEGEKEKRKKERRRDSMAWDSCLTGFNPLFFVKKKHSFFFDVEMAAGCLHGMKPSPFFFPYISILPLCKTSPGTLFLSWFSSLLYFPPPSFLVNLLSS